MSAWIGPHELLGSCWGGAGDIRSVMGTLHTWYGHKSNYSSSTADLTTAVPPNGPDSGRWPCGPRPGTRAAQELRPRPNRAAPHAHEAHTPSSVLGSGSLRPAAAGGGRRRGAGARSPRAVQACHVSARVWIAYACGGRAGDIRSVNTQLGQYTPTGPTGTTSQSSAHIDRPSLTASPTPAAAERANVAQATRPGTCAAQALRPGPARTRRRSNAKNHAVDPMADGDACQHARNSHAGGRRARGRRQRRRRGRGQRHRWRR